jgi:excisionase family DNA binding protein
MPVRTKQVSLDVPAGRLLTISEVADVLGVKTRMVRRLLENGRLPKTKIGRLNRIHPDDLVQFLSKAREDGE